MKTKNKKKKKLKKTKKEQEPLMKYKNDDSRLAGKIPSLVSFPHHTTFTNYVRVCLSASVYVCTQVNVFVSLCSCLYTLKKKKKNLKTGTLKPFRLKQISDLL